MKTKIFILFLIITNFLTIAFQILPKKTLATDPSSVLIITPTPEPCPAKPGADICPPGSYGCGEKDVWVRDYEVEALGKGGERARQFLMWVLSHQSIDSHPTLLWIWGLSRNIVYFLLLITAIFMGIGIIISQGSNINLKIKLTPLLIKFFLLVLYTTFSARIVLLIIQLSDVIMQFFIKTLEADQLFNIFFFQGATSSLADSEQSYRIFFGCRNANPEHLEMYRTSLFLIRFTNMTYYVMGIMLILRKIILWFLMILSPFLAILMPYVFIRNIGWIWIGVFFQWVFYGPLFGLFLGSLAKIWNSATHIPYIFDFSRVERMGGKPGFPIVEPWVYPTVVRILYGGPAQTLHFRNSSNYVDTFAEYVISLLMLWTAIFFPWWLLRIFRDYCCEGIYAAKNILMGIYDTLKTAGLPPGGPLPPSPSPTAAGMVRKIPEEKEIVTRIKLETIEDIKKARTEDIHRVMSISVRKLADVARFETNKEIRQNALRNIEYLQNPMKAETSTERQKFMNIRSELFNRAIKGDILARQTLTSVTTNRYERELQKEKILRTIPQMVPVVRTVSVKVGLPQDKTVSVLRSVFNTASSSSSIVNTIASSTNTSSSQVQTILNELTKTENLNQPGLKIVDNISKQAMMEKEKVKEVIEKVTSLVKNTTTFNQILTQEKITEKQMNQIVETLPQLIKEADKETLVRIISVKADLPEEKTTSVFSSIFKTLLQNNTFVNTIASSTNTSSSQVQTILNELTKTENLNQPGLKIVDNISKQAMMEKEKVKLVIEKVPVILKTQRQFLKEITDEERVEDRVVEKIVGSLFPVVSKPEQNIEESLTIPPKVSLEDYEEVRSMWLDQYEKGEVPISKDIKNRQDWIRTDIIRITNILNKILSPDEKLKAQALEEIGYILPIFMINNLTGEELVVYLKAKLEAAKQVNRELEKEEEMKEKMKEEEEKEEVLVETPPPAKKEEEKTMEMEEELRVKN